MRDAAGVNPAPWFWRSGESPGVCALVLLGMEPAMATTVRVSGQVRP
ncbi:hypothetical protein HMPREF9599_00637 [Cutibacterium acnes HL050PA2]|nr:hypothetical protein HMPREF9599_00637 [Cutibacterium acnes HL050PA2]MCW5113393.1 hypothetical protein [Cutibacterium acnes P05]